MLISDLCDYSDAYISCERNNNCYMYLITGEMKSQSSKIILCLHHARQR